MGDILNQLKGLLYKTPKTTASMKIGDYTSSELEDGVVVTGENMPNTNQASVEVDIKTTDTASLENQHNQPEVSQENIQHGRWDLNPPLTRPSAASNLTSYNQNEVTEDLLLSKICSEIFNNPKIYAAFNARVAENIIKRLMTTNPDNTIIGNYSELSDEELEMFTNESKDFISKVQKLINSEGERFMEFCLRRGGINVEIK